MALRDVSQGFVDGIEFFDAKCFGISNSEAGLGIPICKRNARQLYR